VYIKGLVLGWNRTEIVYENWLRHFRPSFS